MPWNDDRTLWVGIHKTRGAIGVPDTSMPIDSPFRVFLPNEKRIAKLDRQRVRASMTNEHVGQPTLDNISRQYLHHVAELELRKGFAARSSSPEEAHRLYLGSIGMFFAGVRKRIGALPPRAPTCFNCRKRLSSSSSLECVACGWLLCGCGACGCGVTRERLPPSDAIQFDKDPCDMLEAVNLVPF